jgi:hypothetical protein
LRITIKEGRKMMGSREGKHMELPENSKLFKKNFWARIVIED